MDGAYILSAMAHNIKEIGLTENYRVKVKNFIRKNYKLIISLIFILNFRDGSYFKGHYKDNKKNGEGIFKWANNSEYKGQFLDDKMHGFGTFLWANGKKYIGEWIDNKRNG